MALQKLLQLMLILVSLQTLSLALGMARPTPHPAIAKPNCPDTCGSVSLPFPFGIGRGCFLNEWYEIVCQLNGTVSYPRLKRLDLEVLNISLPLYERPPLNSEYEDQIIVKFPVVYSNSSCGRRHNHPPLTLDNSPFVFSETGNIFLAFGCDVTATLQSANSTSLTGCVTRCGGAAKPKPKAYNACSGFGCCNSATLPSGILSYSVDFVNGVHQDCSFASLVQKTWFKPYVTNLYTSRVRGYVPVVLKWGILDSFLITSLGVDFRNSHHRYCENTGYTHQNNTSFMHCGCLSGYNGNPYLRKGCQDIDECKDPQLRCPTGRECRNFEGGYDCYRHIPILDSRLARRFPWGASAVLSVLFLLMSLYPLRLVEAKRKKFQQEEDRKKQILVKLFTALVDLGIARERSFSVNDNIQPGRLFSSAELQGATNKYSRDMLLGKGAQGTVYKGIMPDGTVVAVKIPSKKTDNGNLEEFINEIVILSLMNHRNIVKLLGLCLETYVPLLVYEFIPNGTLYHNLHHPNDGFPMPWDVRLRIAVELAGGLSYMHSSTSRPIYHRDFKSMNVLLDENYRAKIADFGTSLTVSLDQSHATILVQGTFGYFDPEYFRSGQFRDKSDVYSFGVVLAELLTGKKSIFSESEGSEPTSLAAYFSNAMQENRLFDIIDTEVVEHAAKEEIEDVAALIRGCLDGNGTNRPTMGQVASKLESLRRLPLADVEYYSAKESEVSSDDTLTSDEE